jgi:hypothetical protein
MTTPCLAFGCTRSMRPRQIFCRRHLLDTNPEVRFWPRVAKTPTCWLWTGLTSGAGYGTFTVNGKPTRTHRFAYELIRGPIPDGAVLDHLCRVVTCCNPFHLEPVTQKVNVLRGIGIAGLNARKTQCVHGHKFTPENTYERPRGGGRDCRTCVSDRGKKRDSRAKTPATYYELEDQS